MSAIKRHSFLILSLVFILGAYLFLRSQEAIAPQETLKELSESELLEYAQSEFDPEANLEQKTILGTHHGNTVLAAFFCADLCPVNTTRVVYYDVEIDQCQASGGMVKSILMPAGITVVPQEFCFPEVIVESEIYEFVDSET